VLAEEEEEEEEEGPTLLLGRTRPLVTTACMRGLTQDPRAAAVDGRGLWCLRCFAGCFPPRVRARDDCGREGLDEGGLRCNADLARGGAWATPAPLTLPSSPNAGKGDGDDVCAATAREGGAEGGRPPLAKDRETDLLG
jgi:hypothetical protein